MPKTTRTPKASKATHSSNGDRLKAVSKEIDPEEAAEESNLQQILEMLETCNRPATRAEVIEHLWTNIRSSISSNSSRNYPCGLEFASALDVRLFHAAIEFIDHGEF
jgi:hypothetical protein